METYSIPLTYLRGNRFSTQMNAVFDYSHLPRPLHSVAYIVDGCADFFCGNKQIEVCAGDVIYVPKGCRYTSVWRGDPATTFFSCHFDLVPFGEPIGNRVYGLQKIETCAHLQPLFSEVVQKEHDSFSSLYAVGSFLQLLSALFPRMAYERALTINDRIVEAVRYIESHYDSPLRVPELASLCHISPSYFYECFKREMGMSPIEYKNKMIIRHAERSLVDHPDTSIEELSERLGFESSIYFRRLFKATTGKTPREYRKTVSGMM
ncbi:MAG: AraC family transcriptional regulator [Clostridia bacterium]|nr:AraC family transcriptional regulator [Clostridia bacterium]